jgi:hypothetical protein
VISPIAMITTFHPRAALKPSSSVLESSLPSASTVITEKFSTKLKSGTIVSLVIVGVIFIGGIVSIGLFVATGFFCHCRRKIRDRREKRRSGGKRPVDVEGCEEDDKSALNLMFQEYN